jgi:hypothetical protein
LKKPWQKKTSSRGDQIAYLKKRGGKLKRKLKKAKSNKCQVNLGKEFQL